MFADIDFFVFYILFCILVLFSKKSGFQWRRQPFTKNDIVEEKLDDIDINDIRNLEDLPRLVFIHEECEYPKIVNWWWWRAYY